MANITLVDVTVHVDEAMDKDMRAKLENDLRSQDGVVSIHSSEQAPHLIVVTYRPEHATSKQILKTVMSEDLHAELIGL